MHLRCGLASFFATAVVAVACGQNPDSAKSTGQENQSLPGIFPSFCVNGAHAKSVHCLFCEHELYPGVGIIAFKLPEKPSEPLAVLLQKLEARVADNKAAHFGAFAILLTLNKTLEEDPTGGDAVGAAEGLIKDLMLKEVTLGLEHKDTAPLATFGINKDNPGDSEITVLVYRGHKIERRFTFTSAKKMTDADVNEILAAVDKTLPPKKAK
jgi:hypothetical protein